LSLVKAVLTGLLVGSFFLASWGCGSSIPRTFSHNAQGGSSSKSLKAWIGKSCGAKSQMPSKRETSNLKKLTRTPAICEQAGALPGPEKKLMQPG
jgi:hypothetical protein